MQVDVDISAAPPFSARSPCLEHRVLSIGVSLTAPTAATRRSLRAMIQGLEAEEARGNCASFLSMRRLPPVEAILCDTWMRPVDSDMERACVLQTHGHVDGWFVRRTVDYKPLDHSVCTVATLNVTLNMPQPLVRGAPSSVTLPMLA